MQKQITICSNRFYLDEYDLNTLFLDLEDFNKIKYHIYNLLYDNKYLNKDLPKESLHLYIKHRFNLDDYYSNSILREAKGILKSNEELLKDYKINTNQKIKAIESKLKDKETKLGKLNICLEDLKVIQENLKLDISKQKTNLKLRTWVGSNISYDYKNNKDHIKTKEGFVGLYYFEYNYLYEKKRLLKANISKLKYALNNQKTKLNNLNKPKRVCFGGSKFIREQTLLLNNKSINLRTFQKNLHNKKYKELIVSGRCDAKYGNFVFKLNNNLLTFSTMKGKIISLEVSFPYLGDELLEAIKSKMSIAFGYKLKVDRLGRTYIIFSTSFDRALNKYFNTDISTGIIAIDINFGHIDLANIDEKGNLIDYKTINYKITNSSKENELSLRKAICEVGNYVKKSNKILAKENLNLQKLKDKCKYQRKDYNKMLHYFPFAKIEKYLNNEACKNNFSIINVNPSYTSIIGKYKYSNNKKLNTHIAASYVIGRRALRYKEKIPKNLNPLLPSNKKTYDLNYKWVYINKELKKLNKK